MPAIMSNDYISPPYISHMLYTHIIIIICFLSTISPCYASASTSKNYKGLHHHHAPSKYNIYSCLLLGTSYAYIPGLAISFIFSHYFITFDELNFVPHKYLSHHYFHVLLHISFNTLPIYILL